MGARFPLGKPLGVEDSQKDCRKGIYSRRGLGLWGWAVVIWETMFSLSVVFKGPTREGNSGQYLSGRREYAERGVVRRAWDGQCDGTPH